MRFANVVLIRVSRSLPRCALSARPEKGPYCVVLRALVACLASALRRICLLPQAGEDGHFPGVGGGKSRSSEAFVALRVGRGMSSLREAVEISFHRFGESAPYLGDLRASSNEQKVYVTFRAPEWPRERAFTCALGAHGSGINGPITAKSPEPQIGDRRAGRCAASRRSPPVARKFSSYE